MEFLLSNLCLNSYAYPKTLILFVSHSFGVLLENLSFHSSEEETCVKACDANILFDERPIFKLQVRALSLEGGLQSTKFYMT